MQRAHVRRCSVQGCRSNAHALGYCRCHYGRIWRGKPLCGPACKQDAPPSFNLQSLERQLADARRNHDLVVGIEGKMRWRHTIQNLEQVLNQNLNRNLHASVAAG
jgi:hypothetical protein